jgi:hypothetical protein
MTHAHRRPHRYAPPRVTGWAALAAAGTVAVGVSVGLLVTADSADAAPALPAVRYCEDFGGVMRCADREPLWSVERTADPDAVLIAP